MSLAVVVGALFGNAAGPASKEVLFHAGRDSRYAAGTQLINMPAIHFFG